MPGRHLPPWTRRSSAAVAAADAGCTGHYCCTRSTAGAARRQVADGNCTDAGAAGGIGSAAGADPAGSNLREIAAAAAAAAAAAVAVGGQRSRSLDRKREPGSIAEAPGSVAVEAGAGHRSIAAAVAAEALGDNWGKCTVDRQPGGSGGRMGRDPRNKLESVGELGGSVRGLGDRNADAREGSERAKRVDWEDCISGWSEYI